jgi:tetratricopeptide (TPR) repeat protein
VNSPRKIVLVLLTTLLFGLSSRDIRAQLPVVTPHDLLPEQKIEVDAEEMVLWKTAWDKARKSALQGDFETSIQFYETLLQLKNNLEEGRWELARLLMHLERWEEAGVHLELLVEAASENRVYGNSLGRVMWEMGRYERAVTLFEKVLSGDPSDRAALAGLVEALVKQDRKADAVPPLEKLVNQEPTNRGIRRYLAFLLFETGNYEKAIAHLTVLARNENAESDILHKIASAFEHLGRKEQAVVYWERILAREPENIAAHLFLDDYFEEKGQTDRVLLHLQKAVTFNPGDRTACIRLAKTYQTRGEYEKALACFMEYLQRFPADSAILQQAERMTALLAREEKVVTPAPNEVVTGRRDEAAQLLDGIGLLRDAGRLEDAGPLYRQLIGIGADHASARKTLAADLVLLAEKNGREAMLRFLATVAEDSAGLYRSIAEELRSLAHQDELLVVLEKIHGLDPGDTFANRELALLAFSRGDWQKSREYFAGLADAGCRNSRCMVEQARLAENIDLPVQGLQAYEILLQQQPGRLDIRMKAIGLAARLGFLDRAVFHGTYLQMFQQGNENFASQLLLADAYRDAGYLSRAEVRYRSIIAATARRNDAEGRELRINARLALVAAYESAGLPYEAEQALRIALVEEKHRAAVLESLFYLFLRTEHVQESEIWLEALSRALAGSAEEDIRLNGAWKEEFLQAEMYSAAGDYDLAVDLYREAETLLLESQSSQGQPHDSGHEATLLQIRTQLAVNLLHEGRYSEAVGTVLDLQKNHGGKLELLVLLEEIYRAWGRASQAGKIAEEARSYARHDSGRQLRLAATYRKYGNIAGQRQIAAMVEKKEPESLRAKYLLVDAMVQQGKYQATLVLLSRFLENYPENTWFLAQQAALLARVGMLQEADDRLAILRAENPGRMDLGMLHARIVWELGRWKESAALYSSIVEPSVEKILEDKVRELGLQVARAPDRKSWFDVIAFGRDTESALSQIIMAPHHALDFSESGRAVNSLAAPRYAAYRWQKRLSREFAVKRSVMRREYYRAATILENYIAEYSRNDFLLYDLAGLYSKLERLGEEAALYREMATQNPYFPGLAEAIQRNDLKRRPRVSLAYVMDEEDGWDGYKAIRQEMVRGEAQYYMGESHEWHVDLGRMNYTSTAAAESLWGWRTMLTYNGKVSQAIGVSFGAGVENLDREKDEAFLLSGKITGKVADEVQAAFSFKQDVVADTTASLKRGIRKRSYRVEAMLDVFPSIPLGGYYDFSDYSDSNWTGNYALWASFIVVPEPTLLRISYKYDFYDSGEGQNPGMVTEDGFALDDHPYWSPRDYWQTRFSFYFKHQLSNDALARGVPSYYIVEYSLGYDSEDNDVHELRGSLNLEIAEKYLATVSLGILDLDEYQHRQALFSVTYRF